MGNDNHFSLKLKHWCTKITSGYLKCILTLQEILNEGNMHICFNDREYRIDPIPE